MRWCGRAAVLLTVRRCQNPPTQAGEWLGRWVWWWRRAMAATTISLERSVAGCFLAVNEGLQRLVVTFAFGAQLAYQFLALVLLGFGDGLGA